MIRFQTTLGDFTVELFEKEAPISSREFLQAMWTTDILTTPSSIALFPGFVIQGGGLTARMRPKKTRAPITNEATNGLKNTRGTLSMARTNDVNSATSQFFVNLYDNAFLDHQSKASSATRCLAASPKASM